MPKMRIDADLEMHYEVDDFTDPWTSPETVVLLHGNSESGQAWYAWVPQLARDFRVVRPDMRGFGRSTPMPRDFKWSLDVIAADFIRLMDELGIDRFHLVGAKIGGTIARGFAARYPDRIKTLTVVGSPQALRPEGPEKLAAAMAQFQNQGIEQWARATMDLRLGSAFPKEGKEWWIKFMGRTSLDSQLGCVPAIHFVDIRPDVARIKCPTLVITTDQSPLATVAETRGWQDGIPGSELVVLRNDSFHVAVTNPDECVAALRPFLMKHCKR